MLKFFIKIYGYDKSHLINEIKGLTQNCEHAYAIADVNIYVNSKFSTNYLEGFIRKIMKEDIKLGYKNSNSNHILSILIKKGLQEFYFQENLFIL